MRRNIGNPPQLDCRGNGGNNNRLTTLVGVPEPEPYPKPARETFPKLVDHVLNKIQFDRIIIERIRTPRTPNDERRRLGSISAGLEVIHSSDPTSENDY